MKHLRPDQILIECMECGRVRIGRRLDNAPVNATLYRANCGCKPIRAGVTSEPYYLNANGGLVDWDVATALLDSSEK
jgi:hypothetical protein